MSTPVVYSSSASAYFSGVRSALTSVFALVLAGTYVGLGALAHDYGFSAWWFALSSMVIWAAPAQVILISGLGTGAALIETAIAVTLSGIRLLPMMVSLLPLIRTKGTRLRDLILPAHFTSVSMWVESFRLLPRIVPEQRIAFCNGLSSGYMGTAVTFGFVGFFLAAGLPTLFAAALLFLTPMSFLISTARNAKVLLDRAAFVIGVVAGPLLAWQHVELDLLWSGVIGGVIAYGIHRWRGVAA